ncbi:hypothetical protein RRF57_010474 [Xylaria bambusicola]|uniref:Major facilitator superfamily (MFS) profile domain-containing protein n=1 Tax=Xylaria bambusicola TaxID=326684 RepID=A0AAN7Z2S7_9PEZI
MTEPEKSGESSPVIEIPEQEDERRNNLSSRKRRKISKRAAIINAHSWGLNSVRHYSAKLIHMLYQPSQEILITLLQSFAVFLAYYIRTNTYQTTDLGYAFIGGLSLSVALLVSPLATFLVGWGKCGTRPTIWLGVIFETLAFIGSSFASELWHIILAQGVSFGIGLGLMFVASAPVSSQWFYKKRSYAQGWTAAGSGFGGLVYSLATNAMIESIGLAWTFRTLAIICFVVNGVATFFIRDRNHAVGSVHVAFNWALFKRPPFIMFELWMTFSLIGYIILVFSIVAYCQVVGLSASQASLVGALFNLAQGIGRPAVGLSSDSLGRFNVAQLATLWCGLLCLFVWMFGARTYAGCIVFALLSGAVAGTMWAAFTPICAEVVGLQMLPSGKFSLTHFNSIFSLKEISLTTGKKNIALSITWLFLVLPATFAEVIGLSLRSPGSWGYRDVQLFTAFMYIGAFIFGWILRAWKVWEVERVRRDKEQREITTHEDSVMPSTQLRRHASRASTVKEKVLHLKGLWSVQRV